MHEAALSAGSDTSELARQTLREAIAIYGRSAFCEPRRCEAILRDRCPSARREVFLLVSALRENVAEELIGQDVSLPEGVLVTRLTRRLSDHLGLSEDSARWAVDSWRYSLEGNHGLRAHPDAVSVPYSSEVVSIETNISGSALNFPWLGTCLIALTSAVLALSATTAVAFFHLWRTWRGGSLELIAMTLALVGALLGEALAERAFAQIALPDRRGLNPRMAAYALLPEVFILLLLPFVAVAVPTMWFMEWWLQLHIVGSAHNSLFHIIRSMESMVIAIFVYYWVRSMSGIQLRVAGSFIGR